MSISPASLSGMEKHLLEIIDFDTYIDKDSHYKPVFDGILEMFNLIVMGSRAPT